MNRFRFDDNAEDGAEPSRRQGCRRTVFGLTPAPASTVVSSLLFAIVLVVPATAVGQASDQTGASTETHGSSEARTEGEVSNIVQQLSQEIESPYCPGKTLAMCPSGGAAEVRREIQRKAEHGLTKEEIKQSILEEHGEEFRLREPPTEDHYPLIATVLIGLLICIGAVAYFARRGGDDGDDDGPPGADADLSDEDELYLDELRSQYRE